MSVDSFDVMTYMITKKDIDRHVKQINLIKMLGIPIYVRTILQESEWFLKSPYKHIINTESDLYELVDDTGKSFLSFEDLTMRGYLNFKGYNCSAGEHSILLSSTGKIYRCDMNFLYDINVMYDVNKSTEPLIDFKNGCKKCPHKFCSIYYGDKWK